MLTAVYIKGFKTFARPVRMPLEGGVTAIVGPNGSGKSNITDAVLFALGEGSPGVLRAGAMGELIFAGSESLPAAAVAEVTLVLDNESGRVSLPYREVSITRRISRAGETEYKINGSRARLADMRAVAGEAGLGRHSVLRQGSVDAIVAGGAAACRLALEEAAGLGVFRRRRLSASRRLEKADAQLEKSRQLEAEMAAQLRRIEGEAAAAREYRELESRFRELSLAHLYRIATRGVEGLRRRLEEGEARTRGLAEREAATRAEEARIGDSLGGLEKDVRGTEVLLEQLEDTAEDLRGEAQKTDRLLFRLEAGRGREGERRRLVSRLEDELRRLTGSLDELNRRVVEAEAGFSATEEAAIAARRTLASTRERRGAAETERSRLAGELEKLRARLDRGAAPDNLRVLPEGDLSRLGDLADEIEAPAGDGNPGELGNLRGSIPRHLSRLEAVDEGVGKRRGALAAAVGRAESAARALRERAPGTPGGSGIRLYEVVRARPGYETAVEAALGEYGAGVLARDVDEGVEILSDAEKVAVRLDAEGVEARGVPLGKPLLECVEVVDGRYGDAVGRLLAGIYVVDNPRQGARANGAVAVTKEGLRVTRTGLSLRRPGVGEPGFAREARLAAELERLEALKHGPGGVLYDLRARVSDVSERVAGLAGTVEKVTSLAGRASRARALLAREARRRRSAAENRRERTLAREREGAELSRRASGVEELLAAAEETRARTGEEEAAASKTADDARAAAEESGRLLSRLRAAAAEGGRRRTRVSRELDRARAALGREPDRALALAGRAANVSGGLAAAARERRASLRSKRAAVADEHRRVSEERNSLARRAAGLVGEVAAAGAEAERLAGELRRAETAAAEAAEGIASEWGSTLEAAKEAADRHRAGTEAERQGLARRLKRFGDVNLLALAQEEAIRERHDFVAAQRADAEAAAGELHRVIASIDREIEARFSETFEGVRGAFGGMVPRMMAGATGVLDLSEEGVEIGLRLGRKGWRPLRVLSGGERALLALSFLFSIFLARPGENAGTFCVLDEAEAALDDLNLARFLAVVDSYRSNGQYLLVTHQKRTMAAADVLYGVVQDASGTTTVVSKRMRGD